MAAENQNHCIVLKLKGEITISGGLIWHHILIIPIFSRTRCQIKTADIHYYGYPPYYSYADWKDFYGYSNIMTLASYFQLIRNPGQGSVLAENKMQVPSFAFTPILVMKKTNHEP